jgi:hypothetical protein
VFNVASGRSVVGPPVVGIPNAVAVWLRDPGVESSIFNYVQKSLMLPGLRWFDAIDVFYDVAGCSVDIRHVRLLC